MRCFLFCLLLVVLAEPLAAASWKECKSRKLESIRLEKALRHGRKVRGYATGSAMKRERRRLDRWLWKNCRYYYDEFRDLYGEQM